MASSETVNYGQEGVVNHLPERCLISMPGGPRDLVICKATYETGSPEWFAKRIISTISATIVWLVYGEDMRLAKVAQFLRSCRQGVIDRPIDGVGKVLSAQKGHLALARDSSRWDNMK